MTDTLPALPFPGSGEVGESLSPHPVMVIVTPASMDLECGWHPPHAELIVRQTGRSGWRWPLLGLALGLGVNLGPAAAQN